MSRQTFLDALLHPQAGRAAFGTGTSIACCDLMQLTGVSFPEAHLDPHKMATMAAAGHGILGFDSVMPLFSVCHEASAMGCNVNWGNAQAMPESGPPIFRDLDDICIPSDLLQRPGCAVPLQAISLLKEQLGGKAAVCGKVFGPWTQSYHYFGIENFLITTIDDPDKTRRILDRLLPVTVSFANAQIDAGADCIVLGDHATRDLCSPESYEQYLLPLHSQLAAEIKAPIILHICGDTSDRIAMIAQTGIECLHWDTKTGPPQKVRQLAGPNLALIGGISNYKLLRGTPDQIAADAKLAAQAGINIIGPECAIPLTTPLPNLKVIVAGAAQA